MMLDKTPASNHITARKPEGRQRLDDLFTDALMHRVNSEDKPWRGRGRHAKAKRQRAKAKRARGRVVKSIRKAAKRRPY